MKYVFLALCLFLARPAQAFQASSDPQNFFTLLETAPSILVVTPEASQAPTSGRPFFFHRLKKTAFLRGDAVGERLQVVEELLVPGQKPLLPEKVESLVFLAPLPEFTAYRELHAQGYRWRILGGENGVWPAVSTLSLARAYLAASESERRALLLRTLQDPAPRLRQAAARTLAEGGRVPLSSEQAASLSAFAMQESEGEAGLAAVRVLDKADNEAARQALLGLSRGPASPVKWAAIRALEKTGLARGVEELAEDYRAADAAGRVQALARIAAKRNAEALSFFSGLISGPADFEAKREALHALAEQGGAAYEKLLIQQLGGTDESIQAEAILALGKMDSREAVSRILPLLDSPSAKLRGAAFFMLVDSSDPRARAQISQRYERDHHGGWEKNPHFYGNPKRDR